MKRDLAWVRHYERDLIDQDQKRNELYNALWRMVYLVWDFAAEHKAKMKNVRTLVDTSPSDAIHNAAIALSNTVPRWDVMPYTSNLMEYKRTEALEHCLAWDFRHLNRAGTGTVLFDMMFNSLLYDMIVTRVDDLEFQFKGAGKLSPLQQRVRRQTRFLTQVFDPRTIHVESGLGTFNALLHVENLRAWDVYNYWKLYENNSTDGGKQVAGALRQMEEKFAGKEGQEIRNMRFVFFEFINDDQILKHGYFSQNPHWSMTGTPPVNLHELADETLSVSGDFFSGGSDIVFADAENELGFINWSVRMGGVRSEKQPEYQVNPMLAPLHWGNTWETLNVVRSLVMSEPIKRMFEAHEMQLTADGQKLPTSDDGVVVGMRGDMVQKLPPAQMDPNAINVVETLKQELTRTTGANVLSEVTSAKTTPFATLNAMIQVALSRLDVNRRDGALAVMDTALLLLSWVKKTRIPLKSYRVTEKTMNLGGSLMNSPRGQEVLIDAQDFDLDHIEINVDIKPKTPTDMQQQILSAIQLHDKMQVPLRFLLENLGYENVELMLDQYEDEMFHNAEVQAAVQNIAQQEALRAQQQAQQQQMQQPQPRQPMTRIPPPGGGISESAMGALSGLGQGINPAMGGRSPQMFAPGMTREMVTGSTNGGTPLAVR